MRPRRAPNIVDLELDVRRAACLVDELVCVDHKGHGHGGADDGHNIGRGHDKVLPNEEHNGPANEFGEVAKEVGDEPPVKARHEDSHGIFALDLSRGEGDGGSAEHLRDVAEHDDEKDARGRDLQRGGVGAEARPVVFEGCQAGFRV